MEGKEKKTRAGCRPTELSGWVEVPVPIDFYYLANSHISNNVELLTKRHAMSIKDRDKFHLKMKIHWIYFGLIKRNIQKT